MHRFHGVYIAMFAGEAPVCFNNGLIVRLLQIYEILAEPIQLHRAGSVIFVFLSMLRAWAVFNCFIWWVINND